MTNGATIGKLRGMISVKQNERQKHRARESLRVS